MPKLLRIKGIWTERNVTVATEHLKKVLTLQNRKCAVMRERRLRHVDVIIGVRHLVRQRHLLAGRDAQRVPLDGLPQRALLGPRPGLENLFLDPLEVLDNVPGKPVFRPDDDLDDLVKVEGLQLEGLEHPREGALGVVRKNDDLKAAVRKGYKTFLFSVDDAWRHLFKTLDS